MGKPKKYYAVARGRNPGIYTAWFGPDGAEEQIRGYAGARYKGFASLPEAQKWLQNPIYVRSPSGGKDSDTALDMDVPPGTIVIYTDGGCRGNPGPGGYGAVIIDGGKRIELAQGFCLTTNNRMELMACIAALKALKVPADVVLYSDSRYVVNGISRGWARKWSANNWMRTKKDAAENADLWAQLLDLCDSLRVQFVWVRGHAGHLENEYCDELAFQAADSEDLKEDHAYVQGRTKVLHGLFDEAD
ncbi:MAG: ribonuclease HI [Syntrophales bacterium]|nr:ribonuclease HI [Syntrophales bacterium]